MFVYASGLPLAPEVREGIRRRWGWRVFVLDAVFRLIRVLGGGAGSFFFMFVALLPPGGSVFHRPRFACLA